MGNQDKKVNAHDRQLQALELRKSGVSYPAIADTLGYRGKQGAFEAVKAALKKTLQEPADELLVLELERLDAMTLAIASQVRAGNFGAIDRNLRIMKRRAELLGLDAPTKTALTDPTGTKEYDPVTDDERIARLAAIIDTVRKRGSGPASGGDEQGSDVAS